MNPDEKTYISYSSFKINDWIVDPGTGCIIKNGVSSKLEPKAMELLVYLADRPGDVLSRDELDKKVWQGVVVNDDALTNAVTKIRKVFGDSYSNPRIIRTVPKKGYQLIASVERNTSPKMTSDTIKIGTQENRSIESDSDNVNYFQSFLKQHLRRNRYRLLVFMLFVPVVIFFVYTHYKKNSELTSVSRHLIDPPTIAVLPFENLGVIEDVYFSDGISIDLITDLTKISNIRVLSPTSSFAFRDLTTPPLQVSEELGAQYLVVGSIRRFKDTIRLNARLVEPKSGQLIWSERFDEQLDNIFEIQDRITRSIVTSLAIRLNKNDELQFLKIKDNNIKYNAYDKLLLALEYQGKFTPSDNAIARTLFSEATELDPKYARAYAGIARTHARDVNFNWSNDSAKSLKLAEEALNKGFSLEPENSEIWASMASTNLAQRRHKKALEAALKTVQLVPNSADAHAQLAWILINNGKHNEGLSTISYAKKLNPFHSQIYLFVEGAAQFLLNHYDEAIELLEIAVERNPSFDRSRLYYSASLAMSGNLDEAEWVMEETLAMQPDLSLQKEKENTLLSNPKDIELYIKGLRLSGLNE